MESNYDLLKHAIENKMQVFAMYGGDIREMCPHSVGTKNGVQHVLSYQFGGSSSKGLPLGGAWRCMVISRLQNVKLHDGDWHTGDSHSKPNTCIGHVMIEVNY